jgi:hypothetical protein
MHDTQSCPWQILCRVMEVMDERKCTIWEAANVVEELRVALGSWKLIRQESTIVRFKGDSKGRAPYMIRLRNVEFATTALACAAPATQVLALPSVSLIRVLDLRTCVVRR